MTGPKCARAVFGTCLNTVVFGSGSIILDPATTVFPYASEIRLTARPEDGNYFVAWAGVAPGGGNPLRFLITNANETIFCSFTPLSVDQFALTLISNGRGEIIATPPQRLYNSNDAVTITALSGQDQSFVGWGGDVSGLENPTMMSMSRSKIITANFTRRPRLSVGSCLGGDREDGFQFTLTGDLGASFEFQGSTNGAEWTELATVTNTFGTLQ